MSPTLKQLKILKAVVTTRSISKAAGQIGLSQPTLSQQIAKMEEALDTQLFVRGRNSSFQLTGPGEYWYQVASDILARHAEASTFHDNHFKKGSLDLRFSSSSTLRLWFFNKAAELAVSVPGISGLEFVGSRNSSDVLDLLAMHQINCGVVNEGLLTGKNSKLHVVRVYSDQAVWVVPETIPDDVVRDVLNTRQSPENPDYAALTRYVDLGEIAPWRDQTQDWFHNSLPFAKSFFRCPEHVGAARIVAAGLATAHVPQSLITRLPKELRRCVRIYEVGGCRFNVSFVSPKHYQSIPAFTSFQKQLCESVQGEYEHQLQQDEINRSLLEPTNKIPDGGARLSAAE